MHVQLSCVICYLILSGFTQLVDMPTRGSNILDIFATNRPQEVIVSPGLSDHELITVESFIVATLAESQP